MNQPNKMLDDDDEEDTGKSPIMSAFVNQKLSNIHHFYISGPIKAPQEYTPWFQFIRDAGEHDVVVLHINSEGGHVATAIQFMRVLTETKATVVASVEGLCMSAATVIFLCAHNYEISNHSMFMFHNYSSLTIGKGGEMHDQIVFERDWSKKFFGDMYKDFLTDDEITDILNNRDIWLSSSEVAERLRLKSEKKNASVEKVAEAAIEKAASEVDVVLPKRSSVKKTTRKK